LSGLADAAQSPRTLQRIGVRLVRAVEPLHVGISGAAERAIDPLDPALMLSKPLERATPARSPIHPAVTRWTMPSK
jgi:hypothetical protein